MEFLCVIAAAVFTLLILAVRHYGFKWLFTKDGKRILFGLICAPLAVLALAALVGCTRVDIFAGLEHTKKLSPQCESGGANDRITSNLGLSGCRTLSKDGKTEVCGVYRHHSCAISPDREGYDAFGFTTTFRVWGN